MDELNFSPEVVAEPLVKWRKPPKLEDLKQNYTDAKAGHDSQVRKINTYLDNLHGTGSAEVKTRKGNSKIVPKLIRRQAEWRYAALSEPFLSNEDIFNVRPVTWEDRKAAQQNELVLNHQFNNRLDKVAFIDEYVRTAVDEGTVIMQAGWEFVEEEKEVEEPIVEFLVNPGLAPLHEHIAKMKKESPSEYQTDVPQELKEAHEMSLEQGVPIEAVIRGYRKVKKMVTVVDKPTVEILDTRNVVIDPTAQGDIKKARFVIRTFVSSLAELQKTGRYKNLKTINITATDILATPDHEIADDVKNFTFKDKPRQNFIVYEYWGFWDIDGSGELKPIVAAWVGETLIRLELNPFEHQTLPFVVVQYLPVRKRTHGEPDGALLEDNQRVVGAVTRGMIDILGKSANGQTGMSKNFLDATNRRKFDSGLDYEFNPQADPRANVFMHTYNEIPTSAQFMLQLQNLEAESLTGVKSFTQGISGQSLGDVAMGIRGALDAASKRELGILRRLSNGMIELARLFIAMNAQFLDEGEVIRITNEEFIQVKKDDLAGQFDLRLSISTPEEDNNKAEQLSFMLQTVGPNSDPDVTRMILADICRLRKMPDLAKKLENYQPQPDPLAEKVKELEIAKLQAEVDALRSRAMESQANAVLHEAKVGTEQAKAANLGSDTDMKNLDFVEQESGVKQERDLQKQGAQAQAQEQTKITEHALSMEREREKNDNDLLKEYIKVRAKNNNGN